MPTTFTACLVKKQFLTKDVCLFEFKILNEEKIDISPGEYLVLYVPKKGKEPLRRLYSVLTSGKGKNNFELVIKLLDKGVGSAYLKSLRAKEKVKFFGPAGVFHLHQEDEKRIFLATGTGIVPVFSMIKKALVMDKAKEKVVLLWGLKTIKDIYFFEELEKLSSTHKNFNFYFCLSRENKQSFLNEKTKEHIILKRIDKVLKGRLDNFKNYSYYLCGGRPAVEGLKNYLLKQSISPEKIFFEKF